MRNCSNLVRNRTSALSDRSDSVVDVGPDVDEDELIEGKTLFEKTFILKHRSLFSEKLSPDS